MKKITIYIYEFKDLIRIKNRVIDKITFIFSRPKYKIGKNVNYYGKPKIVARTRDWEFDIWLYKLNNEYVLSEGLVAFYEK